MTAGARSRRLRREPVERGQVRLGFPAAGERGGRAAPGCRPGRGRLAARHEAGWIPSGSHTRTERVGPTLELPEPGTGASLLVDVRHTAGR